jgi:hypothetical protein
LRGHSIVLCSSVLYCHHYIINSITHHRVLLFAGCY